jgi:GGDEF domain-containing protein
MSAANRVSMEPEVRTMLGRHREELLRRALALAVSRASLAELAERPLGARLDELELLFEAAAAGSGEQPRATRNRDLQSELDHQLDEHRLHGRVFSVAVIAAGRVRVARLGHAAADRRPSGPDGRAWTNALRECAAPTDVVIDAGDGASAVVFPDHDAREGRIAADRLCRAAWRALGDEGPLAGAGVATYPEDGSSGTEIVAAAYDALWRQAEFEGDAPAPEGVEERPLDDDRPPAPVHPLRPL